MRTRPSGPWEPIPAPSSTQAMDWQSGARPENAAMGSAQLSLRIFAMACLWGLRASKRFISTSNRRSRTGASAASASSAANISTSIRREKPARIAVFDGKLP